MASVSSVELAGAVGERQWQAFHLLQAHIDCSDRILALRRPRVVALASDEERQAAMSIGSPRCHRGSD